MHSGSSPTKPSSGSRISDVATTGGSAGQQAVSATPDLDTRRQSQLRALSDTNMDLVNTNLTLQKQKEQNMRELARATRLNQELKLSLDQAKQQRVPMSRSQQQLRSMQTQLSAAQTELATLRRRQVAGVAMLEARDREL